MKKLTSSLCLLLLSTSLLADDFWLDSEYRQKNDIQVRFGLQRGGDTLGWVFEQETGEISEKIRAGGWYNYSIGYLWHFSSPLSLQLNYGFQRDGGRGEYEQSIAIHAKPIELVPFYYLDRHRFGLGVSYHDNPTIYYKLINLNQTVYMDDSTSWMFQYDYSYTKNLSFGLKYNKAEYEIDSVSLDGVRNEYLTQLNNGEKLDASSFGIHVIYSF